MDSLRGCLKTPDNKTRPSTRNDKTKMENKIICNGIYNFHSYDNFLGLREFFLSLRGKLWSTSSLCEKSMFIIHCEMVL